MTNIIENLIVELKRLKKGNRPRMPQFCKYKKVMTKLHYRILGEFWVLINCYKVVLSTLGNLSTTYLCRSVT